MKAPLPTTRERPDGLQSLATGMKIIEFFASQDIAYGVSQVARHLDMPKAKTHRYLTTLRDLGYLVQEHPSERYRLGWGLYVLSQEIHSNFNMTRAARPYMEKACNEIGMTIVLSTYTEREFIVLDFIAPPSPLEMGLKPGSRFALNTGAQGKIALAFGRTEISEEFMSTSLPASTPKSITDVDMLRQQILKIRKRFWADAPDELFLGVNAVAVPLFGQGGRLAGSIAAVAMTSALSSPPPKRIVDTLNAVARDLSRLLGAGAQ